MSARAVEMVAHRVNSGAVFRLSGGRGRQAWPRRRDRSPLGWIPTGVAGPWCGRVGYAFSTRCCAVVDVSRRVDIARRRPPSTASPPTNAAGQHVEQDRGTARAAR